LGAVGLVFVFWGINWTLSAPNYAAKVNGTEISSNEVRQSYQQQLAQVERQANAPLDEAQRTEIKRRVLDQYVGSEALVSRADDLGYRVSDQDLLNAMAEVPAFQVIQIGIEADPAECNDYLHFLQSRNFPVQKLGALGQLLRRGLVRRRRATHRSRDVQVFQLKPIIAICRVRLSRKPGFVQHRKHEFPRGVAREWPSRAVRTMGAWSEAEDEDSRLGIAEAGHRFPPVCALPVSPALLPRHLFPISNQPGTARAGSNFVVKNSKPAGHCL